MQWKKIIKLIEVKQSAFAGNDADAQHLRDELNTKKTFLLNLMSSPGSGKITTLVLKRRLLRLYRFTPEA